MKSRLRLLETLRLPCFLKTTELNIDAFSKPQTSSRPPAFNNRLRNRNRPFGTENGMLRKLIAVSPDSANLLTWIPVLKSANEHIFNIFLHASQKHFDFEGLRVQLYRCSSTDQTQVIHTLSMIVSYLQRFNVLWFSTLVLLSQTLFLLLLSVVWLQQKLLVSSQDDH